MADDRPVIFLDMDGVLSSPRAFVVQQDKEHRSDRWIDPIAVRSLNLLCQAAGVSIPDDYLFASSCVRGTDLPTLEITFPEGDYDGRDAAEPFIRQGLRAALAAETAGGTTHG